MRRTTSLTAATVLALAALAPATGAASAAGETCRGETATIVGARGKQVVGTEGRDVVVTNRSSSVKTLGGDDLVCITGPDAQKGTEYGVTIDTGPGNDVVDGTAADSWGADVTLGEGADRFEGGDAEDYVYAGSVVVVDSKVSYPDTEVDVIIGGDGDELIRSGQDGLPNSDVVQGGDGDDNLDYLGTPTASSVLDGGAGYDSGGFTLGVGHTVLDNMTGELRRDGSLVSRWTSLESFYLGDPDDGVATLEIRGSDADESFDLDGLTRVTAALGAGDDNVSVPALLPEGSSLAGGDGVDELVFGLEEGGVDWDLRGDTIRADDGRTLAASGFEDAWVSAPRVRLVGTDGPNSLGVNTCDGHLDGRDGKDSLYLSSDYYFELFPACAEKMVMLGGRGHDSLGSRAGSVDRMVGGRGNDRFDGVGGDDLVFGGPGNDQATLGRGNDTFYGGPGRDRVDGEQDRDLCRAERTSACER